jgi:hypothetical protein
LRRHEQVPDMLSIRADRAHSPAQMAFYLAEIFHRSIQVVIAGAESTVAGERDNDLIASSRYLTVQCHHSSNATTMLFSTSFNLVQGITRLEGGSTVALLSPLK